MRTPSAPQTYWDDRAARFALDGSGLAAVCSYGMPEFHNLAIDWTQRAALARWLSVERGTRVLDVGCGIGRWSRRLARRGAEVTGVDLSPTMIDEATRRAAAEGVASRCRFLASSLADLDLGLEFPRILGVTVLQHILDEDELDAAIARIRAHLEPGGRAILLEAAPSERQSRCDTPVFRARTEAEYLDRFARAGLERKALRSVDPVRLRAMYLPLHRSLPPAMASLALGLITAVSLPADLLLARFFARTSWHKVFVLGRKEAGG